jgi:hypothetical protein
MAEARNRTRQMKIKPFFVVFPVIVGVVIYAYYAPEQRPEGAASPKEYIERVEKKRAEKQQAMKEEDKDAGTAGIEPGKGRDETP